MCDLPIVELRAKRIVTLQGSTPHSTQIVCFQYERALLKKYQPLVGEEVQIRIVDTNGIFVSATYPRKQTLLSIEAPNRHSLGMPDDVLLVTIEH